MKLIASPNGLQAIDQTFAMLAEGSPALDACVAAVTVVEDDPADMTVGYGGLPNEDGVVELDAAVMDGATHRGGAVAALQGIRHPTQVARLVMEQTCRVLLAGEGARRFALANGFQQENLLTERARQLWLEWKRRRSPCDDWMPPRDGQTDPQLDRWLNPRAGGMPSRAAQGPPPGTVHCAALDRAGNLACATSTSGHAFKIAGRVGDSPILGAGLYVDNSAGSCGSTGNGEAAMENVVCFAAVEQLAAGLPPQEAGLRVLRQVADRARPEQRDGQGRPTFHLQLFLLAKDGAHAGVSLWPGRHIAVVDSEGARLQCCTSLFD